MIDANYEIEVELNAAVSEFLTYCSNDICAPILQNKENTINNKSLSQFKDNIIIKIPNLYNDIKSIINDPAVTHFLMNSLSDLILMTYEEFLKNVNVQTWQLQDDGVLDFMELDALSGFIGDTVNQLYEDEQHDAPKFNEEILANLELDDTDAEGLGNTPNVLEMTSNNLNSNDQPHEYEEQAHIINKSPSPTSAE